MKRNKSMKTWLRDLSKCDVTWFSVGDNYKYQYLGPDSECSCCQATYISVDTFTPAEREQIESELRRWKELQRNDNCNEEST